MWDLPGPGILTMSPTLAGGFFTTEPPGKPSFQSSTLTNSTVVFIVHGSWCTHAGVSLGCILRRWFAEFGDYSPWLDIASVFFKMMNPVLTPANKVGVPVSLSHLLLSDFYILVLMMGVNYWFQFALPWLTKEIFSNLLTICFPWIACSYLFPFSCWVVFILLSEGLLISEVCLFVGMVSFSILNNVYLAALGLSSLYLWLEGLVALRHVGYWVPRWGSNPNPLCCKADS